MTKPEQSWEGRKYIAVGAIGISFMFAIVSAFLYLDIVFSKELPDPTVLEYMTREELIQVMYDQQSNPFPTAAYLIPTFAFFGALVGGVMYYIMGKDQPDISSGITKGKERQKVLMRMLDNDERKVLQKMIENNGSMTQAELAYIDGFTKVKAHRVVQQLSLKGVLNKEHLGKMRKITIQKDFYDALM